MNSTLTLSGNNTFTGGVILNTGTLRLGSNSALGAGNSTLTINGGTIDVTAARTTGNTQTWNGNFTFAGSNTWNTGSAAVTMSGNRTVTVNASTMTVGGPIAGAGYSLTKSGSGILSLSANNTYSGGTNINAGVLVIASTASLPGWNLNGAYSVASGAALSVGVSTTDTAVATMLGTTNFAAGASIGFDGTRTYSLSLGNTAQGALGLVKTGSGNLTLTGNNSYTGGTTVLAGNLQGSSASLQGNILNNASVTFNQTSNGTYSGVLSGSGSVSKIGNGTLVFTSVNTYSGNSSITAGTLQLGLSNVLPSGSGKGNITLNSIPAALDLNGFDQTLNGLDGSGRIYNSANSTHSTLTVGGNDQSGTFSGTITDTITPQTGILALRKIGSGILILTGNNTYTGNTTITSGTIQIGNGGTTGGISAASSILNNGNVTFKRSNLLSQGVDFSSSIGGSGSITQAGIGTTFLNGTNTYSGGTTVTAGTLSIANTGSLPGWSTNGSYLVSNGGTLAVGNSITEGSVLAMLGTTNFAAGAFLGMDVSAGNRTFAGSLTDTHQGALGLVKTGGFTLILSGINSYSGGTAVLAGTLQGTSRSLQGNIDNKANVNFNQTFNGTYSGVMSGNGTLIKTGNGMLTLTGNNTFTGGVTLNAGTLMLGGNSVLGGGSSPLTVNGGAIDVNAPRTTASNNPQLWNADFTFVGSNSWNTGNGTVTLNGNRTVTVSASTLTVGGPIQGGGGRLTKVGAGVLSLSGNNTYTGGTTVSSGILSITRTSALPGWNRNGSYTVTNGATLAVENSITDAEISTMLGTTNFAAGASIGFYGNRTYANSLADTTQGSLGVLKIGEGSLTLAGNNSYTGGTTVTAGTLKGTASSLQGNINNNASVVFDQTTTGTYSGIMTGIGSFHKTGNGTLVLSGANTYGGNTSINAGTIQLGASNALPSGVDRGNTSINSISASLDLNGYNQTLNGLSGVGRVFNSANATKSTLALGGNDQTSTFSGNISDTPGQGSGVLALVKAGNGTLSLDGINTYTGGTTVSSGILSIGGISSLPGWNSNGSYLVSSGACLSVANTVTDASIVAILNTTNFAQGSSLGFEVASGSRIYSNDLADTSQGALGVLKAGAGTLTLSGNNTYTGGTTVTAGVLQGTTSSLRGSINNNASVLFAQNVDGTYSGVMSGCGNLIKDGNGTLILTGASDFSGNTTVGAGTLKLGASDALPSGSGKGSLVLVSTDVFFDLNGFNQTLNDLSGSGSVFNSSNASHSSLTVGSDENTSGFSGSIMDSIGSHSGVLSLTKIGTGTLALSGINTFTGGTTVISGVLAVSTTASLPGWNSRGSYSVSDGAAVAVGDSISDSDISVMLGTTNFTSGSSIGFDVTSPARTYSSALGDTSQGALGLVKTGNGLLILAGNNTYTGGTTVLAGTLEGTSQSLQGNISNDASVSFKQILPGTYSGTITGNGAFIKSGSGMLTLSGNNTYAGQTTVSGGILQLGASNVLPSGTGKGNLALTDLSAALDMNGYNVEVNGLSGIGSIFNSSNATISILTVGGNEQTSTFNGNLTDSSQGNTGVLALTKIGTGTLILSGSSTYSGATRVLAGTLVINGDQRYAKGQLVIDSGAILGGDGSIGGNTTISGTHSPGNSPGIQSFDGDLTYNAGSTVNWQLVENSCSNTPVVYDQIIVANDLAFAGNVALNLSFSDAGSNIDWNDVFWDTDQRWTLFQVTGSTTGFEQFAILGNTHFDSQGNVLSTTRGGASFALIQNGQNIDIIYTVPENQTLALLALAGGFLMIFCRKIAPQSQKPQRTGSHPPATPPLENRNW